MAGVDRCQCTIFTVIVGTDCSFQTIPNEWACGVGAEDGQRMGRGWAENSLGEGRGLEMKWC